jgi:predicted Zn-dependent peptidase
MKRIALPSRFIASDEPKASFKVPTDTIPTMNRLVFLSILYLFVPRTAAWADTIPLENRVVQHTLSNGIQLLLLERHFSPTVSIRMMFRVGSVDEVTGKTGLAHMFEHMMFKGTRTLGTKNYKVEAPLLARIDQLHMALDTEKRKGATASQKRIGELIDEIRKQEAQARAYVVDNELWNLYEREGASTLNAATSRDYTQYIVDLPSNKLELWAILDSDRLKNPVFRQFYQERDVVKEERRMRVDTNPEGKLFEAFVSTAYQTHPYRNPTIGWEADLDHLNVSDLTAFYKQHYTPNKLTIAIVGDFNTQEVIRMVERYFGSWRPAMAAARMIPSEAPQTLERQVLIRFDAQPQAVIGFHMPPASDKDFIVSYAVSHLLGAGSNSRLYKALIEKKKIATSIQTGQDYPGERYSSLFIIAGQSRHPHKNADILKAVDQELERLKEKPVEDWELEKVRAAVEVGILNTLQTNSGMASTLAYNHTVFGDWRYLMTFQKQIRALNAEAIQNFAKKYFVKENRTIGLLEPIKKS